MCCFFRGGLFWCYVLQHREQARLVQTCVDAPSLVITETPRQRDGADANVTLN